MIPATEQMIPATEVKQFDHFGEAKQFDCTLFWNLRSANSDQLPS